VDHRSPGDGTGTIVEALERRAILEKRQQERRKELSRMQGGFVTSDHEDEQEDAVPYWRPSVIGKIPPPRDKPLYYTD
jgi:hypothetical protein